MFIEKAKTWEIASSISVTPWFQDSTFLNGVHYSLPATRGLIPDRPGEPAKQIYALITLSLPRPAVGEIPVFLTCPDVDPMHSPKIGYSLCSQ